MLESVKDFVPLDELNSERLRITSPFPGFINQHSIGTNIKRINMLCDIGGIEHLRIEREEDLETSSFVPAIAGVDSKGNALAAKTGAKTKTASHKIDSQTNDDIFLAQKTGNGVIRVNIAELTNRILKEERWTEGARSQEAWAYHLNSIIKKGIFKIGVKYSVLEFSKPDLLTSTFNGVVGAQSLSAGVDFWHVYGFLTFWHGVVMPYLINRSSRNWKSSFFIAGPQFDRAILLGILTAGSTLVKNIPETTQKESRAK